MPVIVDANGQEHKRYDDFALPLVLTSASLYRGSHRTFLHEKWDEALKHSRENALAMRRDAWLLSLLRERIEGTVGCKWHLEVDNEKDHVQKEVLDGLTRAVRRTPRLRRLMRKLLDALWFGRYGVQVKWKWEPVGGRRSLVVDRHAPLNGDKIGYTWDHTPYVLLHGGQGHDQLGKADVITTSIHQALLLRGSWRERFLIHSHDPDDADFFEGEMADAVHGVGIRSRIYWLWYLRDEYLSWITDHLERTGLGLVVVRYEQGNAEAEKKARQVAETYSRRTILLLPTPPGTLNSRVQGGASGIEIVETPTAGVETLQTLRVDIEEKIERYVIGQTLSADTEGSGLGGSGVAGLHKDTKRAIIAADAEELAETLTGDEGDPGLVSVMFRWTYPEYYGKFPVRFVFDLEDDDPAQKLEAVNKAFSMGVDFNKAEVRALTGMSDPGPGDDVISAEKQAQQQQQAQGGMAGLMGAGAPPGAAPAGEPPPGQQKGDDGPDAPPGGPPDDGDGGGPAGWHPAGTGPRGGKRWRHDDGREYRGARPPAGKSRESRAFLEHLAGGRGEGAQAFARDHAPEWYAADDPDLFLYGSEDWSGPHRGVRGGSYWINVKTQRKVYSAENPGARGDAHKKKLEDARQQKTAAKGEAKQQKDQAKEQAAGARQQGLKDAGSKIDALKAGTLSSDVARQTAQDLAQALAGMTIRDLQALKKQHGLKASGTKPELARKIAERAFGAGARQTFESGRTGAPAAPAQPWRDGSDPVPGQVYNVPTSELLVDPGRFQFKLNTNAAGVTDELLSVKTFNPDFAGVISVWRDPADGQTYVVNGHHRHELASRLGHPDLAVRYVTAASAKEARAVGALVNIAEGRGTSIDAAKFMRDMGVQPQELEKYGVSLKGKLAGDAASLTRLNDRLFDRLARGLVEPEKALAVAKHLGDHNLQDQLFRLLDQRENQGKDLPLKVVEEMAREMAETPTHGKVEASLFGDIETEESLFVPRNELKAHVRGELAREVADFLAVASKRRAGRVEGAGNVLNVDENKKIAEEAGRVKGVFEKLVNRKGAVSDAVNEAAGALAKAKNKQEREHAKRFALERVRAAVFAEAGVGEPQPAGQPGAEPAADATGEGGGSQGGGGAGEAQPAAGAPADAADAGGGGVESTGLKSKAEPSDDYGVSEIESRGPFREGGFVTPHTTGVYPTRREAIAAARKVVEGEKPRAPQKPPEPRHNETELRREINAAAAVQQQSGRLGSFPHEQTQADFLKKQGALYGGGERAVEAHRKMVQGALAKGQPVPPEVLASYPDLAPPAPEQPGAKQEPVPPSASPAQTAKPPSVPSAAPGGHAQALSAIAIGDLQRVAGFPVRRVGENEYRIETQAGDRTSGAQTGAERRTGYVQGDAARVAKYIEDQTKAQGLHGRALPEALKRAADFEEPSWMDQAGQERAARGFAALPEGATVVSLEEGTHGRTGRIIKDSAGKNRVQLDGEDGFASGHVEPLDPRHSWRAPQQPQEQGPAQGGLFDAPAPPSPAAASSPATQAVTDPHREFEAIRANLGTLSVGQIRERFASIEALPKKDLEALAAKLGRKFKGSREQVAAQLLGILETQKGSQVQTEDIRKQAAGQPAAPAPAAAPAAQAPPATPAAALDAAASGAPPVSAARLRRVVGKPPAEQLYALSGVDTDVIDHLYNTGAARRAGIGHNEYLRRVDAAWKEWERGIKSPGDRDRLLQSLDTHRQRIADELVPGLRKLAGEGVQGEDALGRPVDLGPVADWYEQHGLGVVDALAREVRGSAGQQPATPPAPTTLPPPVQPQSLSGRLFGQRQAAPAGQPADHAADLKGVLDKALANPRADNRAEATAAVAQLKSLPLPQLGGLARGLGIARPEKTRQALLRQIELLLTEPIRATESFEV